MIRFLAILLLVASPAWAEDPVKPVLIFPSAPTPAVVDPAPSPAPAPPVDTVPVLTAGTLYVVQSEVEFFLLASPSPLATITYETGPIKIRGIFFDGKGKTETRTFASKYVAIVDASDKAAGRIELIGVPRPLERESDIVRTLIDIGVAPQSPPPGPDDPIKPPAPAPTGFRVIFAYETAAALTREQLNILHSTAITAFLNQACVKGADGRAEWRKWDKDIAIGPKESATLVELWTAAKPKFGTLPQLIVAVNGEATVMDLPATEAETLAKLKAIAGVK